MQKVFSFILSLFLFCCGVGHGYAQENTIVFSSDRSGDFEIYTMRSDGSNLKRLTHRSGDDIQPVWSPNGKNIIYSSDYLGDFDIYSMTADGTENQLLTNDDANDKGPVISSQGKIAFYTNRDDNWEIYVMDRDGKNKHNITNSDRLETYPFWSPDGKYLVYHTRLSSGNWEIFKRQADGSSPVNLTNTSSVNNDPSISPDGRHVAFWSNRSGTWQIYLMSPDGSGLRQATTSVQQPARRSRVAWSPSGSTLLFPQSHDIYSMGINGNSMTNITQASGTDTEPDWMANSFSWSAVMPAIFYGALGSGTITDPLMKEDIERKLNILLDTFATFSGGALSNVTALFSNKDVVTISPDISNISLTDPPETISVIADFGTGYTAEDGSRLTGSARIVISNITFSDTGMGANFSGTFNNVQDDGVNLMNGSLTGSLTSVPGNGDNLLTGNLNFNHLQASGKILSGNIRISGNYSSLNLSNFIESEGNVTLTFEGYSAGEYILNGPVSITSDGSGQARVTTNLQTNEGPVNMTLTVSKVDDNAMLVNTTTPGVLGPYSTSIHNLKLDKKTCATYPSRGSLTFIKNSVKAEVTFTGSCDGKYRYRER